MNTIIISNFTYCSIYLNYTQIDINRLVEFINNPFNCPSEHCDPDQIVIHLFHIHTIRWRIGSSTDDIECDADNAKAGQTQSIRENVILAEIRKGFQSARNEKECVGRDAIYSHRAHLC